VLAKAAAPIASIESAGLSANADLAGSRTVRLTITNKTTNYLFVTLRGPKTYFFVLAERSTARHQVEAGQYTYLISSASCPGTITKTISLKNDAAIGPFACHKNLKIFPR
jgi:hypothetical protein